MTSIADQQRPKAKTDQSQGRGQERGRQAGSPAQVPAAGWKQILLRAWKEAGKDNIALVAAGVSFYAFLAIIPLMGATVLSYGFIASPETVLKNMQSLASVAPPNISKTVGEMLMNVVQSSGGKKGLGLLLALAIALWGARNAAGSLMTALNIAYEEEEKRGLVKLTLVALAMTLGLVLLGIAAILAMGALHYVETLWPGNSDTAALIGRILTYPLLGVGAMAAAATIYRYGPSRQKAKWTWLTPGSIFSGVGWFVTTIGFGLYVSRFANYEKSYGSIGGIVALLTWLYVSSYVFLLGAEINSEVEHQTAKDTTEGGEKPLGGRGAWSADHVATGVDDEEGGKASPLSSDPPASRQASPSKNVQSPDRADATQSHDHPYLVSRATSRAGQFAGLQTIGMISSILSTAGLSLLRKKGKAKAGAALLGAAAGLALLRRKDD